MISAEYRQIIRVIAKNIINRRFPGLKKPLVDEVATEIAKTIHARMYGANVDGVDSPIWSNLKDKNLPNVDAKELLK